MTVLQTSHSPAEHVSSCAACAPGAAMFSTHDMQSMSCLSHVTCPHQVFKRCKPECGMLFWCDIVTFMSDLFDVVGNGSCVGGLLQHFGSVWHAVHTDFCQPVQHWHFKRAAWRSCLCWQACPHVAPTSQALIDQPFDIARGLHVHYMYYSVP